MSLDLYFQHTADLGGTEPCVFTVFDTNITHNLGNMWVEAGVYDALYENHDKESGSILVALENGLELMKSDPPRFEKHNAPNGWGMYENALRFLEQIIWACKTYPKSIIKVCK